LCFASRQIFRFLPHNTHSEKSAEILTRAGKEKHTGRMFLIADWVA
jgi:hypothetical protein